MFEQANGTWLPMYVDEGTDVLGSVMESNWNSVNPERYGDMHNSIHQLIGLGMDPDGKLRVSRLLLQQITSTEITGNCLSGI